MAQSQKLVLKQQQTLRMTPQLYQAIKIMSLPLLELRDTIQQELEKNPALEIIEETSPLSLDDTGRRTSEEQEYFENTSDPGYIKVQGGGSREDAHRKFIEGVLTRPESLHEHLLWQLRLQPISNAEFRIGEYMIRNLDENGFHIEKPENLLLSLDLQGNPLENPEQELDPEKLSVMSSVKELIQGFDPIGTCTEGYRESILVQIKLHPDSAPRSAEIVERHLELLEREKYQEIARSMRISVKEVMKVKEFLRELDPFPGRNFSTEQPRYVIPDVMIKVQEGELVIVLNDEDIPVLGISSFYASIQDHEEQYKQKDLKRFVKNGVHEAHWFINSIRRRNQTLLKVCKAIVEFQRDFFRKGSKYLVPLSLKDIAAEVGVHEATVSRVTNGKYIQTEWGIFELKYFFTNQVPGGGRFSKEGVKQMILEIVEEEGSTKRLTDQKIGEILEGKGVRIARRTIAKYRKELDIMSSHHR
ncbi:MAG: RNA polymerase factor sigma-54 [Spirochaetaceae bacterium]|nr:MAG: RNA polymerase factor sigma-54 [Spirochaetaceae bacterium]